MSIFGAANAPIVNQRVQQAGQAARDAGRARSTSAPPGAVRGEDEVDLEIQGSAGEDAVRSLTGNGDQETADDRQQQDHYQPPAKPSDQSADKRPRLDLQG